MAAVPGRDERVGSTRDRSFHSSLSVAILLPSFIVVDKFKRRCREMEVKNTTFAKKIISKDAFRCNYYM